MALCMRNVRENSPETIMRALLIQKIGLLSTQGLNITSAHTALDNLSVEPPRHMKEESRVVASAPRSEYVNATIIICRPNMYAIMKARYRYRIYPTTEPKTKLAQLFGCVRVVGNDSLAYCQQKYRSGEKKPTNAELPKRFITQTKKTAQR